MPEISPVMLVPPSHPIVGMRAWKKPKDAPIFNAFVILGFFIASPLVIDTDKQSIAKPSPMNRIVATSTRCHVCPEGSLMLTEAGTYKSFYVRYGVSLSEQISVPAHILSSDRAEQGKSPP